MRLAPEPIAMSCRSALGPWAVSGPAIEAGREALRDREWLDEARAARAADARRVGCSSAAVADAPLRGTILYRLLESPRAPSCSGFWESMASGSGGFSIARTC